MHNFQSFSILVSLYRVIEQQDPKKRSLEKNIQPLAYIEIHPRRNKTTHCQDG